MVETVKRPRQQAQMTAKMEARRAFQLDFRGASLNIEMQVR